MERKQSLCKKKLLTEKKLTVENPNTVFTRYIGRFEFIPNLIRIKCKSNSNSFQI